MNTTCIMKMVLKGIHFASMALPWMQKLLIKFNTTGSCIKGLKLLVSAPSDSVTICCLEVSLVCVLYYNRECSWKPVLPSIVCVLHSHMDSHGLNQSTFAGILPLSYRNFCRSTIFQGVRCETSHLSICCSQIQRCSFYLLKSWGAHWASGKAKDLMSTHTRKFNIWGLGLNSMQGREAKHVKLA